MTLVKYSKILERARTNKKNVEKNKKLGVTPRWSYYFAKVIVSPKKDVTRNPNMSTTKGNATKPAGDSFNKVKIYKADYIDAAKRLIKYVDKNKKLPNYINWNGKKIRVRDYAYNFSKIVVYYADHKAYPNYNTIDTSVWKKTTTKTTVKTIKKYGHATRSGCDNRGQNNGYFCGCHSLQEVFRNLTGKVVPQSTIASVCGTTSDGTDHDGLNTCVAWFSKKYGYNLTVEWKNFSELGWSGVKKIINSSNQDCIIHNLYRDQWGHYEVINKVYDDYCDVQNSLGDYCDSGCYCGYVEERYLSTFKSYINGISQKSVMIITRK